MSALFRPLLRIAAVLLLLVGLFLLGVLLTPAPIPTVQALVAPPPAATPSGPSLSAAQKIVGVYGGLGGLVAPINLPLIMR